MQSLTLEGNNIVADISSRYNLSQDAVIHMLVAVNNGAGSMAQFNCPELGGSGQWMRGGMTMVGDMFNTGLQMTVNNLCNELANVLATSQVFPSIPDGMPGSANWWPSELGAPFSSGGQNDTRYAVFPQRLAVDIAGQVTVYDTLDHSIGGVSQQQGGNDSLSFSSQYGTISVSSLPIVSGSGSPAQNTNNFAQAVEAPYQAPESEPFQQPEQHQAPINQAQPVQTATSANDAIEMIEKLAKLQEIGAISAEEFNAKKADLLSRI